MSVRTMRRARELPPVRVLVLGVYLLDKPNLAPEIVTALQSDRHLIDHRWAAVGTGLNRKHEMGPVSVLEFTKPVNKFTIMNQLLSEIDLKNYDYVLVSDDDIELAPRFLDDFLALQAYCGFALAQPARSKESNVDHPVTRESHMRIARQTRFVEIGPLFSVSASAFDQLLPFDDEFYMGWGLDQVWPIVLERAALTLGIIDMTPVHHRMRSVATTYSGDEARKRMKDSLRGRDCIKPKDMVRAIRTIWW